MALQSHACVGFDDTQPKQNMSGPVDRDDAPEPQAVLVSSVALIIEIDQHNHAMRKALKSFRLGLHALANRSQGKRDIPSHCLECPSKRGAMVFPETVLEWSSAATGINFNVAFEPAHGAHAIRYSRWLLQAGRGVLQRPRLDQS